MIEPSYDSLCKLRAFVERAFSRETAHPNTNYVTPSAGHCAVVAKIVHDVFGGEFVSARFNGASHWFNRIGKIDIDLTGDQYGFDAVRVSTNSGMYADTRVRDALDMNDETRARARILWQRAILDA